MARVYHELARIGSFSTSVLATTRVVISDSALTQRAMSIGWEAVAEVLPAVLRPLADAARHPDAFQGDYRLTALDGVRFNMRNTPAISARARKSRCANGSGEPAFAQLRAVALVELGTHQPLAASLGWKNEGEISLARELLGGFRFADKSLLLADRLFGTPSLMWDIMSMLESSESALMFRVKANLKSRQERELPDGSRLVWVDVIERGGRRKIGTLLLREIVAEVHYEGAANPEKLRFWTTIYDHVAHPAAALVEVYALRWEEELFFRELKSHLHCRDNLLDAQTPETAAQEVLAMLLAAALVATQRVAVADFAGVDTLRVSFAKVYHKVATITEFVALAGEHISKAALAKICKQALEDLAVTALIKKRKGRSCQRSVRQPTKAWPKTRIPCSKIVQKTIIILNP